MGICVALLLFQEAEQLASVVLTWNRRSTDELRKFVEVNVPNGPLYTGQSGATFMRLSFPATNISIPMNIQLQAFTLKPKVQSRKSSMNRSVLIPLMRFGRSPIPSINRKNNPCLQLFRIVWIPRSASLINHPFQHGRCGCWKGLARSAENMAFLTLSSIL